MSHDIDEAFLPFENGPLTSPFTAAARPLANTVEEAHYALQAALDNDGYGVAPTPDVLAGIDKWLGQVEQRLRRYRATPRPFDAARIGDAPRPTKG